MTNNYIYCDIWCTKNLYCFLFLELGYHSSLTTYLREYLMTVVLDICLFQSILVCQIQSSIVLEYYSSQWRFCCMIKMFYNTTMVA